MIGWLFNRHRLLANRELLGRWGERRCEKYLISRGLKKLARNFSCKTGEIDLVMAEADGSIVFVEVRTKADESFASAESSVTTAKKTRMSRAAQYFLATHNIGNRPFRFDVVTIVVGQTGPVQIRHYKNAFVP
jgi:putative endonuclease